MSEIIIEEINGLKIVQLNGRIDSTTSTQVQHKLNELTNLGERTLLIDFKNVNYVSSAGLRIFIVIQKLLKKAGGELLLVNMADNILNIFKAGGFDRIITIYKTKEEAFANLLPSVSKLEIIESEIDSFKYSLQTNKSAQPGKFFNIGSTEKLNSSEFAKEDLVTVNPKEIRFGTGLSALGDDYDEVKNYFGEALVINHSLFYYPAIKKSAVDYWLFSPETQVSDYNFFYGFGFDGGFKHIISFEATEKFLSLNQLIEFSSQITGEKNFGLVFIAESKGFKGISLKKIPILENKENISDIFAKENFANWFDFPVEPEHFNNVIIGCGIASIENTPSIFDIAIPQNTMHHIHCGIFEKSLLNKSIDEFESELKRITNELEAIKIQHSTGESLFSRVIIGIIELKG